MHSRFISLRNAGVSLASLLAIALMWVPQAAAHGTPPALEFYGNFGSAAGCQRTVSRAMRTCFEVVSRLRFKCSTAELDGRGCDEAERDAMITSATQRSRGLVASGCTEPELIILGYIGLADAQLDVAKTCTEQAAAAESLVFGPAMFTGKVEPGPEARDRCVGATARFAQRVARAAVRQQARAFLRMGATQMTMTDKRGALDGAAAKVSEVRAGAEEGITEVCTMAEFQGSYGQTLETFMTRLEERAKCLVGASHVQGEVTCPAPACGNKVVEPGEQCDDGNTSEMDACNAQCQKTSCDAFASTFELIQHAVFENKGCTTQFCHDASRSGGLDLRAEHSFASLVDVPSQASTMKRIQRGDRDSSFLYQKLAAATFGTPTTGSPMPNGGLPPLTQKELEAIRVWIQQGAPETGVIVGTDALLDGCLPPPDPIQIQPPDPPAQGAGVQLKMPEFAAGPHSETEVCFASYYDLTGVVPEESLSARNSFYYKSKVEVQDPLSHHLIIHAYLGDASPNDPGWDAWKCKGGNKAGETCNPGDLAFCGTGSCAQEGWTCKGGEKAGETCTPTDLAFCGTGICGSAPKRSIACIGFGPSDYNDVTAPAWGGTQETYSATQWPNGVYSELPLKGIIVWNSHNFNITDRPATVGAWVNLEFAKRDEQQSQVFGGLLEVDEIFRMGSPFQPGSGIPPYQSQEICWQHTFPAGTRLFELSSHTHKHGKLFRIWDPQSNLIYQSTQYNDPVQLDFNPAVQLDGDKASRTYRYCSIYDNGKSDPADVKLRSQSVIPPPPFPPIPCTPNTCVSGKVGQACSGYTETAHRSCDSTTGAHDGSCDGCNVVGGVTTEDEMFLLIGYYYCDPAFPECTAASGGGFLAQ